MNEGHSSFAKPGYGHLEGYRVKIGHILHISWITRVRIFGESVTLAFIPEQGHVFWNVSMILGYLLVQYSRL